MTDLPALTAFALTLLAFVGLGEGLRAWGGWRAEASRRVVHVLTGLAVVGCPWLFSGPGPIYVLAGVFAAVNLVAIGRGWFPGMHAIRRPSVGTVTFPLALIFALYTCWTLDPARVPVLQAAFLVLALSDPLASVVGMGLRRPGRLFVGANEKSVAGSLAFFASAWALVAGALLVLGGHGLTVGGVLVAALVAAALATGAEALATKGWDNLFIVVAVVVPLAALYRQPDEVGLLAGALGGAAAFLALSYAVRFLTLDGALAAAGLAFSVLAFGGWAWAVPAFAFFFLSSLLSKAGRRRKASAEALAQKGSTRDAGQVYANGGVAWLLLVAYAFFPEAEALYWGFAGAFAAATADTWATEIGTLVGGSTREVWSGRRVPPGTSGGVSVAGTLGAVAGAGVVFAALAPFAGPYVGGIGWGWAVALVVGGGFLASLVDSLLGATAQALYRDGASGQLTERAGANPLVRGWRWVTNDRVNLACTLAGALLPVAVLFLR
jgi:uncharacterized protein (TIGR00297 family)